MRVSRYTLAVLAAGLMLSLAFVLTGCGSDETSSPANSASPAPSTAQAEDKPAADPKPKPVAVTPLTCLKKLGYENAEDRGGGTWRGDNGDGFVIVKKMGSASEAKAAAKGADLVASASGGKYTITSPGSDPNDRIDQTYVKAVARCVKGAK